MKDEKNMNAITEETDAFVADSTEKVDIIEGEGVFTGLMVERTVYESNGKEYWGYFVRGTLRGREVVAWLKTKDRNGYEVLDLVFGDARSVPFYKFTGSMVDATTRKKTEYVTYKIRTEDEDGVYEMTVKPREDSDKALLTMLVSKAQKAQKAK